MITAILPFALVNACGRWYITDGGIYGNRLQNIYLDYKWNCVAFADAGLCSICGYNFGLLELDNFAIDLRWIAFLQLETQNQKRYPFRTGRLFQKTKCFDLERDRIDRIFGFEVDLFLRW